MWVAALDEHSGATYYHNTETGESSWELPHDATQHTAALDVGSVGRDHDGDWGAADPLAVSHDHDGDWSAADPLAVSHDHADAWDAAAAPVVEIEAAVRPTSAYESSRAQRDAASSAAAATPVRSTGGSGNTSSRLVREPHVGGLQLEHEPHIVNAASMSLELSPPTSASESTGSATTLDSSIVLAAATARAAATRAAASPAALRAAAVLAVAEETARLAALPAAARSPPSFGRKTRFGGLGVPSRETERQRRQYKSRCGPSSQRRDESHAWAFPELSRTDIVTFCSQNGRPESAAMLRARPARRRPAPPRRTRARPSTAPAGSARTSFTPAVAVRRRASGARPGSARAGSARPSSRGRSHSRNRSGSGSGSTRRRLEVRFL